MSAHHALGSWLGSRCGPTTQWIFWLRWGAITLVVGASVVDGRTGWRDVPIAAVALAFAFYNLGAEAVRRSTHNCSYTLVALADVPVASLLLAVSGGYSSPLFLLFLLSAATLALSADSGTTLLSATLLTLAYAGTSLALLEAPRTAAEVGGIALRSLILLVFTLASLALVRQWRIERDRARVADAAAHRLSTLNELVRMATAALDLDEIMETVAQLTRQALGADRVLAGLAEPGADTASVWSSEKPGSRRVDLAELGPARAALLDREPAIRHDLPRDQGRSAALAPLLADGETLGVLAAYSRSRAGLGQRELELLKAIADHVSPPIRRARLHAIERMQAERLMELEQARSDFLASASHALRTPLSTIRLVSSLLRTKLEGVGEQDRSLLESLDRNASRLEHLLDELIDAAKLQTGALRLERERVELRHVVHEALAGARQRLGLSEDRLQVELPPGDMPLQVDRPRLEQVLRNLVSTGHARAPDGTPIAVRARKEEASVLLEIGDSGPNLAPEQLERLFVPFSGSSSADTPVPSASGVTLALARMIVELHGGNLWAENRVPGGLVFRLKLPMPGSEEAG